ncbi:MAG: NAD(+)/NADH kinase [Rikenellaceae bacterium]|jgi:NAD+ kinase|nr:NAD(+)/NADH kinase [Rikenellaceae bacterium]
MEIFLFSRPEATHTPEELQGLTCELDMHFPGAWKANRDFAAKLGRPYDAYDVIESGKPGESSIAVSYGGDGTFLDCVRMAAGSGVPILGVNSGRLGFLATVPKEDLGGALKDLKTGRFTIEERSTLRAAGDFEKQPAYPFAFNEFSIQRGGAGMIAVETFVDGQMVATYWGDGAMISTPSGSTAYGLSVGGPVLVPGCECFVISPIAPHNLTMRPVVIPNKSEVTFRVLARGEKPYATLDNQTFPIVDGARFTLSKAKNSTKLVRLQNISFYDTLRNKMMWGIDRRDETKQGS